MNPKTPIYSAKAYYIDGTKSDPKRKKDELSILGDASMVVDAFCVFSTSSYILGHSAG